MAESRIAGGSSDTFREIPSGLGNGDGTHATLAGSFVPYAPPPPGSVLPSPPVPHTIPNTPGDDTFNIDFNNFPGATIDAATAGSALENDVVEFGPGITAAQLHFSRSGADLIINTG